MLEGCLAELFFPSQAGPWDEKWGKERAHVMCEPQMERMSPRMSLRSRGTDQTGPGKRMWILAPASPLLLHFQRCLALLFLGCSHC